MYSHDPTKLLKLSNSSVGVFQDCERAGYFEYIVRKSPDLDWTKPTYFAFGSAFHSILELSERDYRKCNKELVQQCCDKEGLIWDKDAPKLFACLRSYFANFADSKLTPMYHEKWFENDLARGKIDVIFTHKDTHQWYIGDDKTNGQSLDPNKENELINNSQLGLYGAFADVIAEKLGLEKDGWAGVVYREVEKPKNKYKPGESFIDFHKRVSEKGNPRSREIIIHADKLKWDNAYENFLKTVQRAREFQQEFLDGTPTTTRQNFNVCKGRYGTPCKFWSQCYDGLYTDSKTEKTKEILSFL